MSVPIMAFCRMDTFDFLHSKPSSKPHTLYIGIRMFITTTLISVIVSVVVSVIYGSIFNEQCKPLLYNHTDFEAMKDRLGSLAHDIERAQSVFKRDLTALNDLIRSQTSNVMQEIQSQVDTVEQNANDFASKADTNITKTLDLLSENQDMSLKTLAKLDKKIEDMEENQASSKETLDDLQGQILNVTQNTEMLEALSLRLNTTEEFIKDFKLWKEEGFQDILQYHLEENSILLNQNLTHKLIKMVATEISITQDAMKLAMKQIVEQLLGQFDSRLAESNLKLNKVRVDVSKTLDQMKNSLIESIKTDPSFREVLLPKSPVYEFSGSEVKMDFHEAARYCAQKGGHLPTFNSKGNLELEYATLLAKANERDFDLWWLGATDRTNEGQFTWTDGTPMMFSKWNQYEPNNHGGQENCVEVRTSTRVWNDTACSKKRQVICQI